MGESIIFTQTLLDETGFGIDTERGTIEIVECAGYEILIKTAETIKVYIWNNCKYELSVEVPISITDETATLIISKIKY